MFGIGPLELIIVAVLLLGGAGAAFVVVLLISRSKGSTQEYILNLEAENRSLREELAKRK